MHNYSYDKIGNLVADKSEEIEEISWTMQNKVKEIRRTTGSDKPNLKFAYDGLGNRVSKTVIPKNSVNGEDSITTYYVRDAQGNVLATYEKTKYKNGDEEFYLKEQDLYGSSRIGMKVSNQLLASNINGNVEIKEYDGYFTKTVGNKRFELTNHLGNVLAVVSDKKDADNEPDVVSVSDYYPFGMQMPGRIYTNPSNSYRFGFGGHEKVDEVAGTGNTVDMGDRWLSVKLGRTFKMDAHAEKYTGISPYVYVMNSPNIYVDEDGKDAKVVIDGNKITIQTNIILYSKNGNLSKTTVNDIKKQIADNWNKDQNGNSWTYTKEGKTYDVNFDINISVGNSNLRNEANRDYDGKNNYIEIVNGDDYSFTSHVSDTHKGKWADKTTQAYHEFAHIVGLQDRYQGRTPNAGYEGNVMGEYGGKVEQKNIDAILDKPVEKALQIQEIIDNYLPKISKYLKGPTIQQIDINNREDK